MTSAAAHTTDPGTLPKGAATAGLANAVISGAIQAFLTAGHGPVALSADTIGSTEHTVLGTAVLRATMLAMILTAIGHLTLRCRSGRSCPTGCGW